MGKLGQTRWTIRWIGSWKNSPPGPARSGLPKTNDARSPGEVAMNLVRCHKLLGKLSSTLILKYLCINWTENQFSCKLWPNLGWSSRCLWLSCVDYIGSRAICFYMVMWVLRRAEDVWAYPNTSTCSNRCFGDSTAWMEATTREISWVVEPINPTRDRCMISSGLFSQPWPLINISIKLWFMYSMSQDSWTILLGKNQKRFGIYEFYFGILTIARTSSFFFTKRLMPIKHLPDFAESLGPQQQPYSGKVRDLQEVSVLSKHLKRSRITYQS